MNLRTVIVDDEPPAREIIKEYLADFSQMEIVAECTNGRQAVKTINAERPDLVFLDIQMPGLNGFEVLEHLDYLPSIVFSTAYDQFALRAFEVNAVDYLLKPYTRERFAKAVDRALQQRTMQAVDMDRILRLLQETRRSTSYADRIFVRLTNKILPLATRDILWIEAAGDYAQLHLDDQNYLCNLGIGELEKRLDPALFARVHRSYIVAIAAIRHLESDGEGGFVASLIDGTKLRVSRSYAPKVRDLIL